MILAENFGGKLVCPTTNDLCSVGPYHDDWPSVISVSPTQLHPGSEITIIGQNFAPDVEVKVGNGKLLNLEVNATTIIGNVPSYESYRQLKWLVGSQTSIRIKDGQNRSVGVSNAAILKISWHDYLQIISEWMGNHVAATFFMSVGIICLILLYLRSIFRSTVVLLEKEKVAELKIAQKPHNLIGSLRLIVLKSKAFISQNMCKNKHLMSKS